MASDCTPKHENVQTISPGKLTVGVIDIPPFSSYNSGNPKGIDIAIVNKIAKDECLEPVYQQATYADAIQSIAGGTIDMAIGTIDATEKRMKAVDFSAPPTSTAWASPRSPAPNTVADLEKMGTVGTIDGYLWVEDLKKILGDKLKTYPSSVELKADFDAGRLDADVDAYGVQVPQFKDVKDVRWSSRTRTGPAGAGHRPGARGRFPVTKGNTSLGRRSATASSRSARMAPSPS